MPEHVTARTVAVEPPPAGIRRTVEDYEGGVPPEVALFASTDAERPAVVTVPTGDRPGAGDGDDAFAVRYDIDGWGGFTHNAAGKVRRSHLWRDRRRGGRNGHTLIDNVWAWRGDHGNGIGWTANTADTGVVVNGDDVTAYGLFVEHYQRYQTIWHGERGRTVFYQSELPYDPPSQAAWRSPTGRGRASYKVADGVREHEAWGLGVYSYFNQGVDIRCDRGIEAPRRDGVRFHHMVTVFLDGSGGIEKTINEVGVPVVGEYGTSPVGSYP